MFYGCNVVTPLVLIIKDKVEKLSNLGFKVFVISPGAK